MPEEPIHLKGAPLLDIRDLKIEATVYPRTRIRTTSPSSTACR